MAKTLFERYGGFVAVSQVVVSFYEKVKASKMVSKYFEKTNMQHLIRHQTNFIASVMGGPASFTNDYLKRVHADLGITEPDFNEVVKLLRDTLKEYEFENVDVQTIARIINGRKQFIVENDKKKKEKKDKQD